MPKPARMCELSVVHSGTGIKTMRDAHPIYIECRAMLAYRRFMLGLCDSASYFSMGGIDYVAVRWMGAAVACYRLRRDGRLARMNKWPVQVW